MSKRHATVGSIARLLTLLLTAGAFAPAALAAVIPVGDPCTLADAIDAANTDLPAGGCDAGSGPDTLTLSGGVVLDSVADSHPDFGDTGLPVVTTDITIQGAGFGIERDAGAPPFRIFRIAAGGRLVLRDVTLSNGRTSVAGEDGSPACGGGILSGLNAELQLIDTTLTGNHAGSDGGAVCSGYALTILRSAISENSADGGGGGLSVSTFGASPVTIRDSSISGNWSRSNGGGLLANFAVFEIDGCTISDNESERSGGGVALDEVTLQITNTTISGNRAAVGGGVATGGPETFTIGARHVSIVGNTALDGSGVHFLQPAFSPGTLDLSGSIVAGNAGPGADCGGDGPPGDLGGNFAGDASCGVGFDPIIPGAEVSLALADNGGPTLTHALPEGSPAIDAAGACGLAVDQRGVPRSDGACDSGSFEAEVPLPANGDFSSGRLRPWRLHTSDWNAVATVDQGAVAIDVGPGGADVISQLWQKDIVLEGDTTYALRFDASSSLGSNLRVRLLQHGAPFTNYGLAQNVNIQQLMKSFEIVFTTTPGDKTDARLSFLLQFQDRSGFANPDEVYVFDNISLVKLSQRSARKTTEATDDADVQNMPRRGFEASFDAEPRLSIWR